MQQLLKNFRNMFLFRGIAALVFGVIALAWPGLTVLALVLLFGIFAIISGITAVAAALQNREVHGSFTSRFFIKPPPELHERWTWCSSF